MNSSIHTAKGFIEYVENLCVFIEHVYISEVKAGWFKFKVKVPWWYKLLFGWWLKKYINKNLTPRMIIGVKFDLELYS